MTEDQIDVFNKLKVELQSQTSGEPASYKIIIPMIRQIMPGLIAAEIVGVQPMQSLKRGDRESIFSIRSGQPYRIFDGEIWVDENSIEGQRVLREQELK